MYRNIKGIRGSVARATQSKVYDITMIILIVGYTLLVLVQFGLDGQDFYDDIKNTIYVIELCILGIFVIEIFLHICAFHIHYLEDWLNILDIVVIILSIIFVLLDILLDEDNWFRGFLKIRGIFRLLRIFILIRKLNAVRVRREMRKKLNTGLIFGI